MTSRRQLNLILMTVHVVAQLPLFRPLRDHVQNFDSFSCSEGSPYSDPYNMVSYLGVTDNNLLTRFESSYGNLNEWFTITLKNAASINTIIVLDSSYLLMKGDPL